MKVKKIILTLLSTLILSIIAFGQIAYASTMPDVSVKLVSLTDENYTNADEFQYSVYDGDDNNSIKINRIGQTNGRVVSRIYDAYCAWADRGFNDTDSRPTTVYDTDAGETAEIDTYNAKLNMKDSADRSTIVSGNMLKSYTISGKSSYDAILQLVDLFYLEEDTYSNYLENTLKPAILENKTEDVYEEYKNNDFLLNEDEVRAIQQVALWYFTNYDDKIGTLDVKFGELLDNFEWYKRSKTYGNYSIMENVKNEQGKFLLKYLVQKALNNVGNDTNSIVYLYTNNTNNTSIANTQPIIMVKREKKEFDLALRKYISSVTTNGTTTNYNAAGERVPNIVSTDLEAGTDTTATYKHRKDPIVVEKGSTVKYRLVIYNEGEVDGRATIVKDILPAGVTLKTTGEVTSSKGNVYTISSSDNLVTLTMKNTSTTDIPAYTSGTPSSEIIEIECEVTAEPDEDNDKILTNIAWIAEHKSNKGTYTDRDSNRTTDKITPTIPNLVTTDNGYTNNDNHDLTDKDHYFKGQEDDDDFEKIKIKSVKGSYDIVLVKEDKDGEQLNDTATFEVDGVSKTVTGRLTIVKNKKINASNVNTVDTYIIKETVPPDEYCSFDGTIKIEVYKKQSGEKYVVEKIKYYVDNVEVTSNREDLKVYLNTDGNIYVEVKDYQFDLALRKFITKIVSGDTVTEYTADENRVPKITGESVVANTKTNEKEETTAEKSHTKDKIQVAVGDKVTYTIRIYNEGQVDGYAAEVTDYLPDGLSLISKSESTINATYNWVEGKDAKGKTVIKSTYLKDNNKIIKAANDDFNKLKEKGYYEDLLVECVINEKATLNNLKNIAAITKYEDKKGKEVSDRDSDKNEIERDTYTTQNGTKGLGEQDDDDFEDLKLVQLDLALRKFITKVADNAEMKDATEYSGRAPQPANLDKLYDGEVTTATYNHTKQPVKVNIGDYVEYTLRVYNEGSMDGYAREITDHLPEYLEYVDCEQNKTTYKWTVSEDGRTVKTDYLKDTKLNALEKKVSSVAGETGNTQAIGMSEKIILDSSEKNELKIICKVKDTIPYEKNQTNIAEITKYGDKNNTAIDVDRDSQTIGDGLVKLPNDNELSDYKKTEIDRGDKYIAGQQDDDDFEKIYVPKFDLALRKFITKVEGQKPRNEEDFKDRQPKLSMGEDGNIKYEHSKEPVMVVKDDVVTYTLRVFNEGNLSGYASVVTDDIPEGVVFLPENETNKEYRWVMYTELPEGVEVADPSKVVELNINGSSEIKKYVETTDASKAVIIRTDYLSKEQGEARMKEGDTVNPNLIKAFDSTQGLTDTNPDYKDLKVAFKVTEKYGSERILINYAQISDDQDEDGNSVKDIDSNTDRWNEGEDDQDIEKIRVPQFDLALRKWVTQAIVIENGQTTVTETGHDAWDEPEEIVKVELHRKKLSDVTVKFRYSIRVYNQGEIAGYAKEVKDHIPEGLKFVAEDNPDWTDLGNNVITTKKLENTLLQPGEYADVEVLLTWINGNDNLGLKVNYAEISKDYNEWGVPDKDSEVDNMKVRHEDDDDEAPVMLSVSTGAVITYISLGLVVLITIAGGIILIKKYVM